MAIYINNSVKIQINNKSQMEMFNRGPLLMILQSNTPSNWTGGSEYDVTNWNTFFDLPTNGTPFDSVTIEYDANLNEYIIKLFGTGYFVIKNDLFSSDTVIKRIMDLGYYIIEIYDRAFQNSIITYANFPKLHTIYDDAFFGNSFLIDFIAPNLITIEKRVFQNNVLMLSSNFSKVKNIDEDAFNSCSSITTLDFPSVLTIGDRCFEKCSNTTYINLPICTNLGLTVGNDGVFQQITGQTITANFNGFLKTNNAGDKDGDINRLDINNTVNITWIG